MSGQENSSNIEKQKVEKIGFADFLTIYHSYSQTKAENERIKGKGMEFQAKIDIEKANIAELEKKMNSGILSEEEKGKLNSQIEDAKTQVNKKIQEFKLEIASDERQTIEKLIEELKEKISSFGKEKGYSMILDQNQLIFSDISLDLTKEIVDYVNGGVSANPPKPTDSEKSTVPEQRETGVQKRGHGK